MEEWLSLVQVCRRWRSLVFASPRRLNLRVFCTPRTLARATLDVWPALPLVIEGDVNSSSDTDNVVATLGHSNRVCQIFLWNLGSWPLEEVFAAMEVPFPELTDLGLFSKVSFDETLTPLPVIPDSFLGGSAPRLRHFELDGIPFPGLPKLLLSAANLVHLWLRNIPHSGFFSPEAIVALLSALSSLEKLTLVFRSQSRPDWETRRPPPPKRSVIPALRSLRFRGNIEYLEDLVTFIDTPQLVKMEIAFFNQIDFDIPRLVQFIDRTPKLMKLNAQLQFYDYNALVALSSAVGTVEIKILCREPNRQLSFIEQVCNSSLHSLSTVEDLYIEHRYLVLVWKVDANENTLWLQLLLPFTAVKNIYLAKEFAPGIAAALQELVGSRIVEVLPNLRNIFVEGLESSGRFQKNAGQFVAARQLSNHPIVISDWDEGH
jgi:hypothetical protein